MLPIKGNWYWSLRLDEPWGFEYWNAPDDKTLEDFLGKHYKGARYDCGVTTKRTAELQGYSVVGGSSGAGTRGVGTGVASLEGPPGFSLP